MLVLYSTLFKGYVNQDRLDYATVKKPSKFNSLKQKQVDSSLILQVHHRSARGSALCYTHFGILVDGAATTWLPW